MASTNELLQARFRDLCAERDALLESTAPLRAAREPLQEEVENLTIKIKDITAQIRAVEDPKISDISGEISTIVKALNGKTGPQSL